MLAVSFSALDLVGHEFGPRSHEVQDVLVRLDVAIGRLLDALDRRSAPGSYVVAFSADHGVAPLPEQAAALGMDAGRIALAEIRHARADAAREASRRRHVLRARLTDPQLSLTPGTIDRLRAPDRRRRRGQDRRSPPIPGIAQRLPADDMASDGAHRRSDPARARG